MKISVITVCLNAKSHIEKNLISVAEQTYDNFEQIIVDGESNDGTLEIIKKFQRQYRHIKLVSEKDDGIYDAMNKGVQLSTGDVLMFLNADDRFVDQNVLIDIAWEFLSDDELYLLFGNLLWKTSQKTHNVVQPNIITREYLGRKTVLHQSVFTKKTAFYMTGPFSRNYRVVSDYEWMLKVFLKYRLKYKYLARYLTEVDNSGVSNTSRWELERIRVMAIYFSFWEIARFRIIPNLKNNIFKYIKSF